MDTQRTRPQGTSQVILVFCHKKTFYFLLLLSGLHCPMFLVKDNAVNDLPSSGFVPETNYNKTPKKTPVRISFSCIHLYSVVIGYELIGMIRCSFLCFSGARFEASIRSEAAW